MSIQGTSAPIRRQQTARRPSHGSLAVVQEDPGWMRLLLFFFLVTLFIPRSVALQLGSVSLTPALASALVMFPLLIFGVRIKFTWPDIIVVLFFLSTFYSTLASSPAAESVESFGRRVLVGGVPYLVGRYVGSRPAVFNTFLRQLMGIMAVLALFLILESVFRFNIHSKIWFEPYTPHKDTRLGLTRAYGWTDHSIMLGVSYAIFVPVMMVAALEKMGKLGNYRWLKLGLLLVGVFTSLSTGAWMPAFLAMALVGWDYLKVFKPSTRWLIMSVGSVSTYLVLEVLSGRPLMRILMMKMHLSDPHAWHYRWSLYQRVYDVMPGHEWFGHGLNTPGSLANSWEYSIDNNFLVVLMQYGRMGLTLWLAVGASVLIYGWKTVWKASDMPYRRVARAVMFAIVTICLTQFSVALFSTAEMLYWLFLGLGIGIAQGLAVRPKRAPRRAPQKPSEQRPQPMPPAVDRSLSRGPSV